jgi:hypothetical protein
VSGFRVQGVRVQGVRVQGVRVQGVRVQGSGFRNGGKNGSRSRVVSCGGMMIFAGHIFAEP